MAPRTAQADAHTPRLVCSDALTPLNPPLLQVLLILIVCFYLGTALLRMPFLATLLVGLALNVLYGAAAIADVRQAPEGAAWYPVALVFATVACAVASHSLERAQRQLFLSQMALPRASGAQASAPAAAPSAFGAPGGVGGARAACPAGAARAAACPGASSGRNGDGAAPSAESAPCFLSPPVAELRPARAYTPPTCILGRRDAGDAPAAASAPLPVGGGSPAAQPGHASALSPAWLAPSPTRCEGRRRSHSVSSLDALRQSMSNGIDSQLRDAVGAAGGGGPSVGRHSMEALGHAVYNSLQELPGAVANLLALRGVTSGANSVEAVQNALAETGAASLHEFLGKSIARSLHELPSHLAVQLHVPRFGQPAKRRPSSHGQGAGGAGSSAASDACAESGGAGVATLLEREPHRQVRAASPRPTRTAARPSQAAVMALHSVRNGERRRAGARGDVEGKPNHGC